MKKEGIRRIREKKGRRNDVGDKREEGNEVGYGE